MCPVCQAILRPGELQEHMEQELTKLAKLQIRYRNPITNNHRLVSQHSLYNPANLFCPLPLSLCNIIPSNGFIALHLFLLTILYFPPTFHFLHLSICHFLSVLFSSQVIINVDSFCSCRDPPTPSFSFLRWYLPSSLSPACSVYKLPHCSLHISYYSLRPQGDKSYSGRIMSC